jgi:hypothetical protein
MHSKLVFKFYSNAFNSIQHKTNAPDPKDPTFRTMQPTTSMCAWKWKAYAFGHHCRKIQIKGEEEQLSRENIIFRRSRNSRSKNAKGVEEQQK